MFVVIRTTIVVAVITRGRIGRIHQRHVAFPALDGLVGIAFVVPVAGSPIIVLVLELYPADAVDFLIDELLVARRAVLRLLEHSLAQLGVFAWVGSNQKIPG